MSFQGKKKHLRALSLMSAFIVLTAIGALVTIPVFTIPITMQVPIVLLSGFFLGKKYGLLSQLGYLALGLLGLPIFSAMRGGPGVILTPTFGFLIGFPVAAFVCGMLREKINEKNILQIILIFFIALIPIYLFGLLHIWLFSEVVIGKRLSLNASLSIAVLPFILPEFAKIIFASLIARSLKPLHDEVNQPTSPSSPE